MKLYLSFLFIVVLFVSSCSNDEKVTFNSSIEGWTLGYNSIYTGDGHSGKLCSKTDSLNPYSFGFVYPIKDISKNKLTKADFSAWVKVENIKNEISLVASIWSDKKNSQLQWVGINVSEQIKTINKWTLVKGEIIFSKDLPDDAVIKFYVWSPKADVAFIDDFEIIFY